MAVAEGQGAAVIHAANVGVEAGGVAHLDVVPEVIAEEQMIPFPLNPLLAGMDCGSVWLVAGGRNVIRGP